ncbi:hypothetical protein COC42_10475 [Sphingomonas spermidinifaciens]|uniref:Uncharacterized protein n=1 Tax=Sphingomonas spermidinifaciens TaxID=1141889 RepID=A0A2A4B0H1_9SPHN|nr:hypothetical protein [Sphingomonas spermidinifaciens]PCD01921.1 hypothetical protein COC42_10475 [Sphingomonas spermidinifaciens]
MGVKIVESVWVPSAAVVPQECGPGVFLPVDGAAWSEQAGYNRGFFSAFRLHPGRDVWFHFPIPTSVHHNGEPLACTGVSLLWETLDGASIHWVVLQHGGMERLPLTPPGTPPPSVPVPFDPPEQWREYYPATARRLTELPLAAPLRLRFGLQLSVGVSGGDAGGTVRFYGAGADFVVA